MAASAAAAQAPPPPTPPPDHSAISQYVEQVPTGAGPRVAGIGQAQKDVPEPVRQQIQQQGGSAAPVLEQMARSSYGSAPAQPAPAPTPTPAPQAAQPEPEPEPEPEAEPEPEPEPELDEGPAQPAGVPGRGADEGDMTAVGAAVSAVSESGSNRVLMLLGLLGVMSAAAVGTLVFARRR